MKRTEFEKDLMFLVACFAVMMLALLSLHAHGQTVTKNAGQLRVTGARWADLPDGGCTIQPECSFVNPNVRCDSSPEVMRAAMCTAMRQSANRAAANGNGVGDGGQP